MDCIYNKVDKKVDNILNKILEIDFISSDDIYENIKVTINYNGDNYIFGIKDTKNIKRFIDSASNGSVEEFSDLISNVKGNLSDISKKQIEGAKNNISNFLKSSDFIISKRDKITVFKGLNDSKLKSAMDTNYSDLTTEQKNYLSNLKIPVWELIIRNSGGHPSITNISGLNFLAYNRQVMKIAYKTENYTDILKMIARDFINNLKEKIDAVNSGEEVTYDTKGIELYGQDTNESFEYQLFDKETGVSKPVTREDFIKAGADKAMRPDRKSLMTIDTQNKRVIAKFESFNIKK